MSSISRSELAASQTCNISVETCSALRPAILGSDSAGAVIAISWEIVDICEFAKNCQSWFPLQASVQPEAWLYDFRVQADYSIELGHDDPTLEFPWKDREGRCRYFDLKRQPELLAALPEANEYQELREFLARVNSPSSMFETAKCDAWSTTRLNPEEDIFEAGWKFGSYVDLLFSDFARRYAFDFHESMVRELVELLKKSPEIPAAAEFLVRRCYYRLENREGASGFYVSLYCFGYGEDNPSARKQWGIALSLINNAIRQLSAKFPSGR
jgi:hypothetical protein